MSTPEAPSERTLRQCASEDLGRPEWRLPQQFLAWNAIASVCKLTGALDQRSPWAVTGMCMPFASVTGGECPCRHVNRWRVPKEPQYRTVEIPCAMQEYPGYEQVN